MNNEDQILMLLQQMQTDMRQMQTGIQTDMRRMQTDIQQLQTDMQQMQTDMQQMQTDMQQMQTQMQFQFKQVNDRLDALEESTEMTRDAVNVLIEWSERVSKTSEFPIPDLMEL